MQRSGSRFFQEGATELTARHYRKRRWYAAGVLLSAGAFAAALANAQVTAKPAGTAAKPAQEAAAQDGLAKLAQAVELVRGSQRLRVEYNYVMTGKVRLLLFWVGKDDVGGGYVRRGQPDADAQLEAFELLMGSDPAKATRNINRWGAVKEVVRHGASGNNGIESSAFFGFMKASKGSSVSEMEKELSKDGQSGGHLFEAIINRVDSEGGISKVVPFRSEKDFTLYELQSTEQVVFDRLASETGRMKRVDEKSLAACGKANGFLSSVSELVDAAMAGRKAPVATCYFYHGERFTMKLKEASTMAEKKISVSLRGEEKPFERTYRDLLQAKFEIENHMTGKISRFELLLGTKDDLRGAPVQIDYQPNWWFRVILNLKEVKSGEMKPPMNADQRK